jgi:hypothetical protein
MILDAFANISNAYNLGLSFGNATHFGSDDSHGTSHSRQIPRAVNRGVRIRSSVPRAVSPVLHAQGATRQTRCV